MELSEQAHFLIRRNESEGRMVLDLGPSFTHEHWETLSAVLRAKVADGLTLWDIDLRRMQLLNSLLMGALIGMNMVLHNSKGDLRLIVTRDSRIAGLLYMAKLNLILTVIEF